MFYTYVYRDAPNGEPFYVGKGSWKRTSDHLRFHSSNELMRERILEMKARGVVPHIERIQALDEDHAYFMESCLVEIWKRKCDGGSLLNLAVGGWGGAAGVARSDKFKAEMSARRKGVAIPHSAQTRAKMSLTHRGMPGPNLGRKFGPRPTFTCLKCHKVGPINIMKSKHLDAECKEAMKC